ncbi:hypothetical protein [Paenibacillus sp. V4I7]|uniref:hypothetical protein n=1 Tax=Paenibacillus sp. V4I7 TaxID=3042307 RepID=UPI00359463CC
MFGKQWNSLLVKNFLLQLGNDVAFDVLSTEFGVLTFLRPITIAATVSDIFNFVPTAELGITHQGILGADVF